MDDEVRTQLVCAVANSIDDHLEGPVEREDGEAVAVCSCGWRRVSGTFTVATLDYARHRAAAVVDALGIELESESYGRDQRFSIAAGGVSSPGTKGNEE